MRVHINLDDDLVRKLDERVGARQRSAFIAKTLQRTLENERCWDEIIGTQGTIDDQGHDWDEDPAGWVHAQRFGDAARRG